MHANEEMHDNFSTSAFENSPVFFDVFPIFILLVVTFACAFNNNNNNDNNNNNNNNNSKNYNNENNNSNIMEEMCKLYNYISACSFCHFIIVHTTYLIVWLILRLILKMTFMALQILIMHRQMNNEKR